MKQFEDVMVGLVEGCVKQIGIWSGVNISQTYFVHHVSLQHGGSVFLFLTLLYSNICKW